MITGARRPSAASFDGVTKYLSAASSASLASGGGSIGVACWVRAKALPAANTSWFIAGKATDDDQFNSEYALKVVTIAGLTYYQIQIWRGGGGAVSSNIAFISATEITLNTWYLLTAWWDSVNEQLSFKLNNGTTRINTNLTGVLINNTATAFEVGLISGGSSILPANVDVDGLVFWKRALTEADCTELWNNGNGIRKQAASGTLLTSCSSWWEMDEATGLRRDSIGTNHLTDNNSVLQVLGKT